MGHQIFQSLLNLTLGISALEFDMFTVHIELCGFNGFYQIFHRSLLILGSFFLLVTDNILNRFRKLVDITLFDILTNLHGTFQRFIIRGIRQHNDGFLALGIRHQSQLGFFRIVSCNRKEAQAHPTSDIANGNTIHHLIEGEVVFAVAIFLGSKNISENHLPDTVNDRSRIDRRVFDFSLNVLFFIGQEVVNFSSSSDIVLAHKPVQTFTDSLTHGDLVHANIICHQNYNIVQIGRNIINVTNQVQQFQHIHILCFDTITIVSSFLTAFNYTAD